jgi:Periplasmic binding protein-like domain
MAAILAHLSAPIAALLSAGSLSLLVWLVKKGVLPSRRARQDEVDVRSRCPRGQRLTVGSVERERGHPLCDDHVPARPSLVGYDNSHLVRLRSFWLTSIDGAGNDVGRRAATTLPDHIDDPARDAELHLLTPVVRVRGSSAPPAGSSADGALPLAAAGGTISLGGGTATRGACAAAEVP